MQALDVLPDAEGMAAFLQFALREVPGVANAFMCLDGRILPTDPAGIAMLDPICWRPADSSASGPLCAATSRPDIHLVTMRTPHRTFGCLQVVVDDTALFKVYEPFLLNIGQLVATILENRENARSLAEANAQLNRVVEELEDRVESRTTELQAAEERYRTTLATLPDAISTLRAIRGDAGEIVDFQWTYANPAEAVRHPGADLPMARLLDQRPEYRALGLFDALCQVVTTGEQTLLEVQDAHAPATIAECRASRLGDGVVMAFRDVTYRKAAAHVLATSEARYRLLAENASDMAMMLTPDWRFEWVSDSVMEVLGWRPADLVGRAVDEFIALDDVARFRKIVADAPGGAASIELRFRRPDRSYQWVACRTRAKLDPVGAVVAVVGAMVDITDRKAAEAELSFSASHDPLTGLANRTMLLEETGRALEAGRRSGRTTALLMVDLDHFKTTNDSLGHGVGDALLCAVARRIVASVRPVDLVARPGGDEFVVLLRGLDEPTDAIRLAERLVVESRESATVGGLELFVTTSVGIAEAVPGVGPVRGAEDLLREADTAMYAAKVAGRDRFAQFNDDLRSAVNDRQRLENGLRHALARDEFAVWYQPEIDLHDGTVRAAEALLRWKDPDVGIRVAAEFIDVAEDSGLILDIGTWVLRQACADAARWATGDPPRPLVLRVNLSPLQLSEPDLLATIDGVLSASGLDPRLLCVEITETTVLSDNSTVKVNLNGIRARGIELAIDDFGTGYGSLTYLRRYPISVLKIDLSFVTHITADANDRNLVAGVVALADRLGISVTAEGIETPEQEKILSVLGCSGGQGFLYSPAIPIEEWTDFIQGHQNFPLQSG